MKQILKKVISRLSLLFSQFYRVPYCVPAWGWTEHLAILRCFFTGRLINGPDKERLYLAIREKTGVRYVYGFDSGSEAIQAALKAYGIGYGEKVVLPSYCCETVARAVVRSGAKPVFCDIDENYNPDVGHILTLIDPSVRAIIFPHLFGNPAAIDEMESALEERKERAKILLIDDAAQSFGARLNGKLVGTFGDVGIISFGPGKTMAASGGGLLMTNSKEMASVVAQMPTRNLFVSIKIKRLSYYLFFRRWRRFSLPFYFMFRKLFREPESDSHTMHALCNVDAAIAVEQVEKLDSLLQIRVDRKKKLDDLLSDSYSDYFRLSPSNGDPQRKLNVATKYIVRYQKSAFQDLKDTYNKFLRKNRIELWDLYTPIHYSPAYMQDNTVLPATDRYFQNILQIPIEPSITAGDFDLVFKTIKEFIVSLSVESSNRIILKKISKSYL